LEVTGEDGLDEGAEDDLGARGLGKGHPEDHDKFESIIESYQTLALAACLSGVEESRTEPVNGINNALNDATDK